MGRSIFPYGKIDMGDGAGHMAVTAMCHLALKRQPLPFEEKIPSLKACGLCSPIGEQKISFFESMRTLLPNWGAKNPTIHSFFYWFFNAFSWFFEAFSNDFQCFSTPGVHPAAFALVLRVVR